MTLMDPEWQSIIASVGFASVVVGVKLVIQKNKIKNINRFKIGIV